MAELPANSTEFSAQPYHGSLPAVPPAAIHNSQQQAPEPKITPTKPVGNPYARAPEVEPDYVQGENACVRCIVAGAKRRTNGNAFILNN